MKRSPRSLPVDRLVHTACWSVALILVLGFLGLTADIFVRGLPEISVAFVTESPRDAGRAGGIGPILVSTMLILTVCLAVAVPFGIATAAWLAELTVPGGRAARWVQRSLDILASVPSIVFGLFGMTFFCQILGWGFSILAGGITLATMILPIVVQTTYAGFRSAPVELRTGAAALGFRRVTTIRTLLLPAAFHGVVVGVILGTGRALAETAALIFTSGYVTRMPESLFDSGRSLSVHIYDLAMNVPGGEPRAYATALILLTLLLGINVVAQFLSELWLRVQGRVA